VPASLFRTPLPGPKSSKLKGRFGFRRRKASIRRSARAGGCPGDADRVRRQVLRCQDLFSQDLGVAHPSLPARAPDWSRRSEAIHQAAAAEEVMLSIGAIDSRSASCRAVAIAQKVLDKPA